MKMCDEAQVHERLTFLKCVCVCVCLLVESREDSVRLADRSGDRRGGLK